MMILPVETNEKSIQEFERPDKNKISIGFLEEE